MIDNDMETKRKFIIYRFDPIFFFQIANIFSKNDNLAKNVKKFNIYRVDLHALFPNVGTCKYAAAMELYISNKRENW